MLLRVLLPATDRGSDTRLTVALPFANEQLDMAASQQANRMIPLPESQRASSSQLSDIEAADEPDGAPANLTPDINDATFHSGDDHDLEYLHALLRSLEDARAATPSDSRSDALLAHGAVVLHAHACFTSTYVCKYRAALHQLCMQAHHLCKAADYRPQQQSSCTASLS